MQFKNQDVKILCGVGRYIVFQRSQNVRSIETIKTIDSLLHYRDCYQPIAIAALISN